MPRRSDDAEPRGCCPPKSGASRCLAECAPLNPVRTPGAGAGNAERFSPLDRHAERQLCAVGMTGEGEPVLMAIDIEGGSPGAVDRAIELLQGLQRAAAADPSGWHSFQLRRRHYSSTELGHD